MTISIIAAVSKNRVIGKSGKMPWRLPADLKHFYQLTKGKPVIMGRKTFESLGQPLPKRTNIIITRDKSYQIPGCIVVHSKGEALEKTKGKKEVMIAGGASIYKQFLPLANRLYLTLIHHDFEGDAYFPEFNKEDWKEIERIDHRADAANPYSYSFVVLDKERMRGKLIVFEGLDTCGKETQSALLIKRLEKIGKKTILYAFPRHDTETGQEIKRRLATSLKPNVADLFTQEFLNTKPEIKQYLKQGYFVICDRYTPSNWAYQKVKIKGMPKPDLIIILDLPPSLCEILNQKRRKQVKDAHEKDRPLLERAYERYKKLANGKGWRTVKCFEKKNEAEAKSREASAKWEILPKEIIAEKIWQEVQNVLKP